MTPATLQTLPTELLAQIFTSLSAVTNGPTYALTPSSTAHPQWQLTSWGILALASSCRLFRSIYLSTSSGLSSSLTLTIPSHSFHPQEPEHLRTGVGVCHFCTDCGTKTSTSNDRFAACKEELDFGFGKAGERGYESTLKRHLRRSRNGMMGRPIQRFLLRSCCSMSGALRDVWRDLWIGIVRDICSVLGAELQYIMLCHGAVASEHSLSSSAKELSIPSSVLIERKRAEPVEFTFQFSGDERERTNNVYLQGKTIHVWTEMRGGSFMREKVKVHGEEGEEDFISAAWTNLAGRREEITSGQRFLWLRGTGIGKGGLDRDMEIISMYEKGWSLGSVVRSWR